MVVLGCVYQMINEHLFMCLLPFYVFFEEVNKSQIFCSFSNQVIKTGVVVHNSNPSYSGGGDREGCVSRP
jgi:hypothetical protein